MITIPLRKIKVVPITLPIFTTQLRKIEIWYGVLPNYGICESVLSMLKNFVKKYRIACKLSQLELAECVGVSRNSISSIECHQYIPTAETAAKLCLALGVKFEDLFYLKKDK